MDSVKEYAYAKVNLYLNIINKRKDGFHDLLTIMQLVSLRDEVNIKLITKKQNYVSFTNTKLSIDQTQNLAYRAAEKFYEKLNDPKAPKVSIKIKKKIPVAGGMAGGSADAGAVLRGLNKLFDEPFSIDELCDIASQLGSDVPFCTKGGVQICTGRGEVMTQTRGINHMYILLASAGEKKSTAEQFKRLDEKFDNNFIDSLSDNFVDLSGYLFSNKYDQAISKMYNIFDELYEDDSQAKLIKEIMHKRNCKLAMLSGSGPTIFGVFENSHAAEAAKRDLSKAKIKSIICHPINKEYSEITDIEMPWDHYFVDMSVFSANKERILSKFKIKGITNQ